MTVVFAQIFSVLLAALSVVVNWAQSPFEQLKVSARGGEVFMTQCLKTGSELRVRFEVKVCKRRFAWYDGCGKIRVETRGAVYDPISDEYRITSDVHQDDKDPITHTVNSEQGALDALTTLPGVELRALEFPDDVPQDWNRVYAGVRVRSECRGEGAGFFEQIPTIITFGILDSQMIDSGWTAFDIHRGSAQ